MRQIKKKSSLVNKKFQEKLAKLDRQKQDIIAKKTRKVFKELIRDGYKNLKYFI